MTKLWVADDLPFCEFEEPQYRGDSWSGPSEEHYPEIKNPIGFMRFKRRVRVKAWIQPIPGTGGHKE